MAETRISVRATPEEKEYWEKAAEAQGLNFADFVREALNLKAGFDPKFVKSMKRLSSDLGISESIVIQNSMIARMARDDARAEVWGQEAEDALPEFTFTRHGPITGDALYKSLKENHVREFEQEKLRILLDSEATGVPLLPHYKEWLDKHRPKTSKGK